MKETHKLWTALIITGIIGGMVGIVLTEIMHTIQHLAYGYGSDGLYVSFREGVSQASPERHIGVMTFCGAVVGLGWWLLKRYGRPQPSIKAVVKNPLVGFPFFETVSHALLQIITVGLGSPLGREVAPREMTAAFASVGVNRFGLSEDDTRLVIACASGAGLAAVYNVPLASTLFILEAMLGVWTQQAVAAALLTSVIATAVARIGLGDVQQYHPANLSINTSLLWFSAIIGQYWAQPPSFSSAQPKSFPSSSATTSKSFPWPSVCLHSLVRFLFGFPKFWATAKQATN